MFTIKAAYLVKEFPYHVLAVSTEDEHYLLPYAWAQFPEIKLPFAYPLRDASRMSPLETKLLQRDWDELRSRK